MTKNFMAKLKILKFRILKNYYKFLFYIKHIDYKQKTKQILRNNFVQDIAGFLVSLYIRFIYNTSKIVVIGDNTTKYLNTLIDDKPTIVMCWHGRIFIAGKFMEQLIKKINYKKQLLVLSSKHKDGEIASKTLEWFNFKKIGGSTINPKKLDKKIECGAIKSIIVAIRELKKNRSIFLSPDGPRGPKYQMNSKIVDIGKKTNAILFPVSISYSKKIQTKSWDEFNIPLPFGKIYLEFIDPIELTKDTNTIETDEYITNIINAKMKINDELVK